MSTTITFNSPTGTSVSFTVSPGYPAPIITMETSHIDTILPRENPGSYGFIDGDIIRHCVPSTQLYWFAIVNSKSGKFVANSVPYDNLTDFAWAHNIHERPGRFTGVDGWKSCEVLRNGLWIQCDVLRRNVMRQFN